MFFMFENTFFGNYIFGCTFYDFEHLEDSEEFKQMDSTEMLEKLQKHTIDKEANRLGNIYKNYQILS